MKLLKILNLNKMDHQEVEWVEVEEDRCDYESSLIYLNVYVSQDILSEQMWFS
jgi:hypothetical protein